MNKKIPVSLLALSLLMSCSGQTSSSSTSDPGSQEASSEISQDPSSSTPDGSSNLPSSEGSSLIPSSEEASSEESSLKPSSEESSLEDPTLKALGEFIDGIGNNYTVTLYYGEEVKNVGYIANDQGAWYMTALGYGKAVFEDNLEHRISDLDGDGVPETVSYHSNDFSRHYASLGFPYTSGNLTSMELNGETLYGVLSPSTNERAYNYGGLGIDYATPPFLYDLSRIGGCNMSDFSYMGASFSVGGLAMSLDSEASQTSLTVEVYDSNGAKTSWSYVLSNLGSTEVEGLSRLLRYGLGQEPKLDELTTAFENLQSKKNATMSVDSYWVDGDGNPDEGVSSLLWTGMGEYHSIGYFDSYRLFQTETDVENGRYWAYDANPNETDGNYYNIYRYWSDEQQGYVVGYENTQIPSSVSLWNYVGLMNFTSTCASTLVYDYANNGVYEVNIPNSTAIDVSVYYENCNYYLLMLMLAWPVYADEADSTFLASFVGSSQLEMFFCLYLNVNEDLSFNTYLTATFNDGTGLHRWVYEASVYDIGTTTVPTDYLQDVFPAESSEGNSFA